MKIIRSPIICSISSASVIRKHVAAAAGNEVDILIAVRIVDQRAESMRHAQVRLVGELSADLELIGDDLRQQTAARRRRLR